MYDIQKLSHRVLPDARSPQGIRPRNMARMQAAHELTDHQLGGEAFGAQRLRRRVRDIRRRAPFFADLDKQPGLGGGRRPVLLGMIVGEAAGLEDDGAQFGDAAATTVVEMHKRKSRKRCNCST